MQLVVLLMREHHMSVAEVCKLRWGDFVVMGRGVPLTLFTDLVTHPLLLETLEKYKVMQKELRVCCDGDASLINVSPWSIYKALKVVPLAPTPVSRPRLILSPTPPASPSATTSPTTTLPSPPLASPTTPSPNLKLSKADKKAQHRKPGKRGKRKRLSKHPVRIPKEKKKNYSRPDSQLYPDHW